MKAQENNKRGGILLMAMLMVLIFSILAIGLFKLFDTDAMEAVSVEHHRRAFWMAEMGLEKVMDRLQNDESFRYDPNSDLPYPEPYAGGAFSNASFTIEPISMNSLGNTGSVYTVVSQGTVGSMTRRVQQEVLVRPGGDSAISSPDGNVEVDANVDIDGNIHAAGNVDFASNTELDGVAVVGGNVTGSGAGDIVVLDIPPPPAPSIDTTFWNPFFVNLTNAIANTNANTSGLSGVSVIDITTGGVEPVDEFYYDYASPPLETDNSLTISGTASGVSNFHYMISAVGILFDNRLTLEAWTVVIVDGDVQIDQNYYAEENCIIYATGDIWVRQSSDTGSQGVTLIAEGDITMDQQIGFNGIIFANGTVDVGQNAEIRGTIIGGDGVRMRSNAQITFDPNVFLNPLPGLNNIWNQANFEIRQWEEIAPAP